jgi:hypothetical protein
MLTLMVFSMLQAIDIGQSGIIAPTQSIHRQSQRYALLHIETLTSACHMFGIFFGVLETLRVCSKMAVCTIIVWYLCPTCVSANCVSARFRVTCTPSQGASDVGMMCSNDCVRHADTREISEHCALSRRSW